MAEYGNLYGCQLRNNNSLRKDNEMKKVKTLITMIKPTAAVKNLLAEIEPYADISFLKEGESVGQKLKGLEVLYGSIPEKDFAEASTVRWIQTNSTGVEHMMYPAFIKSDIILTNAGPSITTIVAEHAVTMLFALARNLHIQRDYMHEHKWEIECGIELGGISLGILGFGRIGRAMAARAGAFVKEIHALDVIAPEKTDYVKQVYSFDELPLILKNCNAVICSLPLTSKTKNLFSDKEIAMMQDKSYLINISRGGVVDEAALCRALQKGKLAGAGLDVTEIEPYPADGPLWNERKLLLTPHSAGYCERLEERKISQFIKNFKAYIKDGRIPESLNKNRGW